MNLNSAPKSAEQPNSAADNPWSDLADEAPDWQTLTEQRGTVETAEKPSTAAKVAALLGEDWPEASRPQLSESERRFQVDREGVDIALHALGSAARGNLAPDDRFEVELSLDILDEVSEQLNDEKNDETAYDILESMVQKYDRLADKAPTRDRRRKYLAMAQIANKQRDRFDDWKALDRAKNTPKSKLAKAFDLDTSSIV